MAAALSLPHVLSHREQRALPTVATTSARPPTPGRSVPQAPGAGLLPGP